ncbi:hypothetical protein OPT61_g1034 [Boeremia exigua]|uniref:Uncharacterized protein n=1 Tax=Boeremia exigua TaxID=749465 RepID=A0ACC2IRS5_9PLEO|nr:hypothetical protein OPT61_g1034 [Boeremia exigua]
MSSNKICPMAGGILDNFLTMSCLNLNEVVHTPRLVGKPIALVLVDLQIRSPGLLSCGRSALLRWDRYGNNAEGQNAACLLTVESGVLGISVAFASRS